MTEEEERVDYRVPNVTCPACLREIAGDYGEVEFETVENQIRAHIECSFCEAPLYLVLENEGDENNPEINPWVMERDEP